MKTKLNKTLKLGLLGNAVFSFITGVSLLVAAEPIGRWIGAPHTRILGAVGLILIPFAAHLFMAMRRRPLEVGEIYYLSALDALWVGGSVALLLTGWVPLTVAGTWTLALVALLVCDFMLLQLIGLTQLKRQTIAR